MVSPPSGSGYMEIGGLTNKTTFRTRVVGRVLKPLLVGCTYVWPDLLLVTSEAQVCALSNKL